MDNTKARKDRRRETGEDFTPPALVEEMLNLIPEEAWKDQKQSFLDPSCGNGNFLIAVKERLLGLGFSEEDALSRIYGIDLMHDNVVEACERLGVEYHEEAPFAVGRTILCANTLKHEGRIPELFEKARVEFLYYNLKNALLALRPLVKGAANDEATAAWKAGREIAKELRRLSKKPH
jgi:hypothetical protein